MLANVSKEWGRVTSLIDRRRRLKPRSEDVNELQKVDFARQARSNKNKNKKPRNGREEEDDGITFTGSSSKKKRKTKAPKQTGQQTEGEESRNDSPVKNTEKNGKNEKTEKNKKNVKKQARQGSTEEGSSSAKKVKRTKGKSRFVDLRRDDEHENGDNDHENDDNDDSDHEGHGDDDDGDNDGDDDGDDDHCFPSPPPPPPPPPPAPPSAPPPSTPPGPGVATKFSCPPTPEMCSFVFEGYESDLPTITLPALSSTSAASKQSFRPKTAYDQNLEPGTLVALLRGSSLDLSDTVADMSRIMCLGGQKKNATLPRFTFKLTPDGHLRYDDTRVNGENGSATKRDLGGPAPAAAGSAMSPELTPDAAVEALGTAASQENAEECAAVLARLGRSADSLPADLADAIARGRVPGAVVERYAEMENTVVLGYLMRFGGFKERLLADDLFMTKVAIECGIGICTKTSAELERRRGAFFPEFDFVIADVIMALIADFMLVWLPAPTIPLHPALAKEATALQKFLDTCPDNAFQVPVRGTEYTLLQRFMAVLRNGAKLMVVGTTASLFGCGMTNALQWVRRELAAPPAAAAATIPSLDLTTAASFPLDSSAELAATLNPAAAIDAATTAALVLDPSVAADVAAAVSASAADVAAALATAAEVATAAAGTIPPDLEVPILATSLAYGSYAAISANLRYQILAGVIEQQWLEPRFHGNKTLLSVLSFFFRTSNTFIGSLLWVDYARWIGVQ
ncbi:unnamed protein product [Closterium sp. NIES-54]